MENNVLFEHLSMKTCSRAQKQNQDFAKGHNMASFTFTTAMYITDKDVLLLIYPQHI